MRTVLRLLTSALLGWATYVLSITALDARVQPPILTSLLAVVVAVSAILQFLSVVSGLLGSDRSPLAAEIESLLQDRLVHAYDQGLLGSDLTRISAHVWEVPAPYRRLIPISFRRFLRKTFSSQIQRLAWRPKLHRVASFHLRQLPPTGIEFRKGKGIVGAVLVLNESHLVQVVDFRNSGFLTALAGGERTWHDQPLSVTRNLEYWEAERLSRRYEQAMATVIQDSRSGEGIGALTLEVADGFPKQLGTVDELLSEMRALATLIGPMLAHG
ncbi:hypothetical protein [Cryptosporangium sp. NPDC051539]|uniref:hypothetical protein n=1 Tax=Cryptosporangium sp. NPDC051539 TaxID=3363962 RepID=UPI00379FAC7C